MNALSTEYICELIPDKVSTLLPLLDKTRESLSVENPSMPLPFHKKNK